MILMLNYFFLKNFLKSLHLKIGVLFLKKLEHTSINGEPYLKTHSV